MTVTRTLTVAAALALPIAWAVVPRPPRPQNLVIVTLDTTRADRLPAYGYGGVATPALDRLAREGVVFDQAMSVAPLTLTSHSSLFTGLYPPHHGVRDNSDAGLDPSRTTMAEVWRAKGFRTAAFVGSSVLASDRGLAQGFDVYDDGSAPGVSAPRRRPGSEVVDRALTWLNGNAESSFFLWLHLYDVHAPQTLPDDYRLTYSADPYAGGIALADSQIGRFIDALERKHVLDKTVVIVTGDHGESLGDHGEVEHGIFLYESVLHVPLMVRAPGLAARRVSALASLVDVLPTALDLFGYGPMRVDGVSLLPGMRGSPATPERPAYAESMYALRFGWSPLRVLRDGRYKLIDAPRPELFDLETDPFEEHDLSGSRPATVIAMRAGLQAFDEPGAVVDRAPAKPSPEIRTRLAALGYASGARVGPAGQARDPKDFIQIYNAMRHPKAAR